LKIDIDTNVTCVTLITNAYGGDSMADMNLRDVPDDLHRKAKAEAALEGISLKALVIKALEEYLKKKK
jgi:predicted HicB family RNase H-like nuclease